jgi:hypothetical protein
MRFLQVVRDVNSDPIGTICAGCRFLQAHAIRPF